MVAFSPNRSARTPRVARVAGVAVGLVGLGLIPGVAVAHGAAPGDVYYGERPAPAGDPPLPPGDFGPVLDW